MATYKAVMRLALKYASSVWSPIASSTSINKLQVMQNVALRTATGCTQDTNIQHLHYDTHTPHTRAPTASRLTIQTENTTSPFLKSYLHKVDAKHIHHHYAPSVTSTHTTHIISSTAPTYAPHCHPWICGHTPP